MEIELLVVPDCPGEALAVELIEGAVESEGVSATVTRTLIETREEAEERGFVGSPTILVDGVDPFAVEGASVGLACRRYATPEGLSGVPTLEELRAAFRG